MKYLSPCEIRAYIRNMERGGQSAMARELGLDRHRISFLGSDRSKNPTWATIAQISEYKHRKDNSPE